MTGGWADRLRALAACGPVAMVTILATEGSAPRGAGTRMLVTAGETCGTIGGGRLEHRAIDQARALLDHAPASWRVQDYPLGPLLGQCCGGRVRLMVERCDPASLDWAAAAGEGAAMTVRLDAGGLRRSASAAPAPRPPARGALPGTGDTFEEAANRPARPLYLFGAGHVGQAIARHAAGLPLRPAWFDTRPEMAGIDGVTLVADGAITDCVADAPPHAAVLILTHDHGLDYRLTRAALGRSSLAYVGLIGSATKRARFLNRLTADGVEAAARAGLTCPIGLPGIAGKEPDVIAIAALAQILQLGAV